MARRTPHKYRVCYSDTQTTINYVDRTATELRSELERVQAAVLSGVRILAGILRLRNALIIGAYVQLKHCLREIPATAAPEEVAMEIARLSHIMGVLVESLNKLSNSRINNLQEARFILTYGQTPKKREPMTSRPRVARDHDDDQATPEDGDYADE